MFYIGIAPEYRGIGIVTRITQDHSRSFEVNYEGRLAIVVTVRNNTNIYTHDLLLYCFLTQMFLNF